METPTYQQHSHCSFCGEAFAEEQPWPRRCHHCANLTFLNPTPVAVLLQPVDKGVLTVRRSIRPHIGELALPGGYIDFGEKWQAAAGRELFEEAGVWIEPSGIQIFDVVSAPRNVLIFGIAPPLSAAELTPFQPNEEASERVIVEAPIELAFPIHTDILKRYFESQA